MCAGGEALKHYKKYNKSEHWIWQWFLGYDTKGTGTKEKTDKLDFMKILKICASKDTMNRVEKQPTDWEEIFANHIYD